MKTKNLYSDLPLLGRSSDREHVRFDRTPFEDEYFISNHTVTTFSGNDAPNLPLMQNREACKKRAGALSRLSSTGIVLFMPGLISNIMLALILCAIVPFFQDETHARILVIAAFVLSIFGLIAGIAAAVPLGRIYEAFKQKCLAAYGDFRLLDNGWIAIMSNNFPANGRLEEYQTEYTGRLLEEATPETEGHTLFDLDHTLEITKDGLFPEKKRFKISPKLALPFQSCVYVKRISQIRESAEKDMLFITCSGTYRFLNAGRTSNGHTVHKYYYEYDFTDYEVPFPKRDWDMAYLDALERLK